MAPDTTLPRPPGGNPANYRKANCAVCRHLRMTLSDLLAERGWQDLAEPEVATAAGIDVADFLRHYPSVTACTVAAFEEAVEDCHHACSSHASVRRNCTELFLELANSLLNWVERNPRPARLVFVVGQQSREPAISQALSEAKGRFMALFERTTRCTPAGWTHVEFVVGLAYSTVNRHLRRGEDIRALRAQLLALLPFLDGSQSNNQ